MIVFLHLGCVTSGDSVPAGKCPLEIGVGTGGLKGEKRLCLGVVRLTDYYHVENANLAGSPKICSSPQPLVKAFMTNCCIIAVWKESQTWLNQGWVLNSHLQKPDTGLVVWGIGCR